MSSTIVATSRILPYPTVATATEAPRTVITKPPPSATAISTRASQTTTLAQPRNSSTPKDEAADDPNSSSGTSLWIILVCVLATCIFAALVAAAIYRQKQRRGGANLEELQGDIAAEQTTDLFVNPMFSSAAAAAQEGGDLNTRRSTQRRCGMDSRMPNAIFSSSEPDMQENNRRLTAHIDEKVCQRGIIANVV